MPTIDDVKRAPPGHHWPLGSPQAEQLAREQRERELAAYERWAADNDLRRAEAAAAAATAPVELKLDTPPASNESGAL